MKILNYSKFKKNDSKVYNIAGYSIPGGISTKSIIASVIGVLLINLIAYPIFHHFGVKYFDIAGGKFLVGTIMIVVPIILANVVIRCKINNIPLYEYAIEALKFAIKPKNTSLIGEKGDSSDQHISFKFEDPI